MQLLVARIRIVKFSEAIVPLKVGAFLYICTYYIGISLQSDYSIPYLIASSGLSIERFCRWRFGLYCAASNALWYFAIN